MAKTGRKQKPYVTTSGEIIPGLAHQVDGRWRIVATGVRFTELDERRAVAKAKAMMAADSGDSIVRVDVPAKSLQAAVALMEQKRTDPSRPETLPYPNVRYDSTTGEASNGYNLEMTFVWPWLREQLLTRPAWVGEHVGIPELASLARFALPKPGIRLSDITEAYRVHSPATDKSKREALAAWDAMVAFTGATTTDDLTDAKLAEYRAHVVGQSSLTSSGTIVAYFSRCKSVVKLAGRGDFDAATLATLAVRLKGKLYAPKNNVSDDPKPISRDDFHTLLAAAGDGPWRAWLLLGLNAALYCEDVCGLEWDSLNLDAGTFVGRRRKRGNCIRAATLWPETVAALRAILRRGESPYVFTSSHGTRYNRNTRINDFREFADAAGCPGVTFSHLRDAAYTAATHGAPDERWARLLAGHKAPGLTDKYVARNPTCVKPACDAVYREYGPFPKP